MRNKFLLKFLVLTITLANIAMYAVASSVQAVKFSVNKSSITYRELFDYVENSSSYRFSYKNEEFNDRASKTINYEDSSLPELLSSVLSGTDYAYKIIDKDVIITKNKPTTTVATSNVQQKQSVKGVVLDETGAPMSGVTVIIRGTTTGDISSATGEYQIANIKPSDVIEYSFFGYKKAAETVGTRTQINVQLQVESIVTDEIVVTALGIKRSEKALGYSVQKVEGDALNVVKGANVASTLTGKVAGLNVKNSSEFAESPTLQLRGESPLLVIDGVPYANISLNDIASDDIESMSVLKGATASALYGSRGGSGAILITTKKGATGAKGLTVTLNSSTMFEAGFTTLPEVQSSYSSGSGGKYATGDFVWGAKLDEGVIVNQHNPTSQQWEDMELRSKGKNNLKNFMQSGMVTNNNISVAYQGEKGSFRTSLTYVHNKGQYPNTKQNKITYSLGGDIKLNKFTFEGNMTFNKRFFPNNVGSGYGGGGYLYNLLVWTGSEYDVRDYKNYWVTEKENIQQNWMDDKWYDNPWFIANEITHAQDYNFTNGFLSAKYEILKDFNVMIRSGFDFFSQKDEWRNAISAVGGWDRKGYYEQKQNSGFSTNNDIMLTYNKTWGKFNMDLLAGGTLYYYDSENIYGRTSNGITVPGFYSLNASVDPAKTGQGGSQKQVNSLYGKATFSWDNYLFVDVTARNDWSSSLPASTRSYFYPSVAGSFILSELIDMPTWWDMVKIRGSWTKTKSDISIYDTKNVYSITTNMWDGLNGASYPGTIRPDDLRSQSSRSYEFGTSMHWLRNRIWLDVTYYNKVNSDFAVQAPMSEASGFSNFYVNSNEKRQRQGVEIAVGGTPVKAGKFVWQTSFNWSRDRYTYKELDPIYSTKRPWVKEGERYDWVTCNYIWDTDDKGNVVHGANGMPSSLSYENIKGYSNPDWIWGFNNSFIYGDFTLNIQFDGRVGGVAYNWTDQALWNSGAHKGTDNQYRYDEVVNNKKTFVGNGVQVVSGSIERDEYGNVIKDNRAYKPNDKIVSYETYMTTYHWNSYTSAPQSYYSQTFFKLRELSLGYTLPRKYSEKVGMKDLTISFVGNNLWLWTKEFKYSDPDKGSDNMNAPSMRYLGFNVRMAF